jgi:plasmid stabilization system protein ParE
MTRTSPPKLVYGRASKLDIKDAALWYQRTVSPGVAQEFLAAVEQCVSDICAYPEAHSIVFCGFRKALVPDFPYSLFYVYERRTVRVKAVMHWKRDPEDWRKRAKR